jgi:pro-sigmaK processing inhibitor BofA
MAGLLIQIVGLIAAVLILYILFKIMKSLLKLLVNSIVSLILLFLLNMFFGLGVDINIFSILIVALAGFPGLLLVLILHFLGIAF